MELTTVFHGGTKRLEDISCATRVPGPARSATLRAKAASTTLETGTDSRSASCRAREYACRERTENWNAAPGAAAGPAVASEAAARPKIRSQ